MANLRYKSYALFLGHPLANWNGQANWQTAGRQRYVYGETATLEKQIWIERPGLIGILITLEQDSISFMHFKI